MKLDFYLLIFLFKGVKNPFLRALAAEGFLLLTFQMRYGKIDRSKKYADVSELADEPVLETGAYACRFKSCHPHQKTTSFC